MGIRIIRKDVEKLKALKTGSKIFSATQTAKSSSSRMFSCSQSNFMGSKSKISQPISRKLCSNSNSRKINAIIIS